MKRLLLILMLLVAAASADETSPTTLPSGVNFKPFDSLIIGGGLSTFNGGGDTGAYFDKDGNAWFEGYISTTEVLIEGTTLNITDHLVGMVLTDAGVSSKMFLKWDASTQFEPHALVISDLTNTAMAAVADNQAILYETSTSKWTNRALILSDLNDWPTGAVEYDVAMYDGSDWAFDRIELADLTPTSFASLTTNDVLQYNGSNWINDQIELADIYLMTNISGVPTSGQVFTGDGVDYALRALAATDLSDTTITALSTKEVLIHNGSALIDRTLSIDDLDEVVYASAASGQILEHDGSTFVVATAAWSDTEVSDTLTIGSSSTMTSPPDIGTATGDITNLIYADEIYVDDKIGIREATNPYDIQYWFTYDAVEDIFYVNSNDNAQNAGWDNEGNLIFNTTMTMQNPPVSTTDWVLAHDGSGTIRLINLDLAAGTVLGGTDQYLTYYNSGSATWVNDATLQYDYGNDILYFDVVALDVSSGTITNNSAGASQTNYTEGQLKFQATDDDANAVFTFENPDATYTLDATFKGTLTAGEGADDAIPLVIHRDTDADDETISVTFEGEDDGSNDTVFASIKATATDVTDATEDGTLTFYTMLAGSATEALSLTGADVTTPGDLGISRTSGQAIITALTSDVAGGAYLKSNSAATGYSCLWNISATQEWRTGMYGSENWRVQDVTASTFPLTIALSTGATDVVGAFTAGSIASDAGITAVGDIITSAGVLRSTVSAETVHLALTRSGAGYFISGISGAAGNPLSIFTGTEAAPATVQTIFASDGGGYLKGESIFQKNTYFLMDVDVTGDADVGGDADVVGALTAGTIASDAGVSGTTGTFSGNVTIDDGGITLAVDPGAPLRWKEINAENLTGDSAGVIYFDLNPVATAASNGAQYMRFFRGSSATSSGDALFQVLSPGINSVTFEIDAKTGDTDVVGALTAGTITSDVGVAALGGAIQAGVAGTTAGGLALYGPAAGVEGGQIDIFGGPALPNFTIDTRNNDLRLFSNFATDVDITIFNAGAGSATLVVAGDGDFSAGLDVGDDLEVDGGIFAMTNNTSNTINIGQSPTGDQDAVINLIGDTTNSIYGLKIKRSGGVTGESTFFHKGTGAFSIYTEDAAAIYFATNGIARAYIEAAGDFNIIKSLIVSSDTTLGDAVADTITCNGSFFPRVVDDSDMVGVPGTEGEIAYNTYDNSWYGSTNTNASATWVVFN